MFVCVVVVLRFCVDPGIVRDGRETSFPSPGGRFRARGVGFGEGPGGPKPYKNIRFYSHPDVRRVSHVGDPACCRRLTDWGLGDWDLVI